MDYHFVCSVTCAVVGIAAACGAEPSAEPSVSQLSEVPTRQDTAIVDRLVQAMTLDEKIGLLIGNPIAGPPDPLGFAGAGYLPGVPRLGIPPLRFSDGPAGIRTPRPTTALP